MFIKVSELKLMLKLHFFQFSLSKKSFVLNMISAYLKDSLASDVFPLKSKQNGQKCFYVYEFAMR